MSSFPINLGARDDDDEGLFSRNVDGQLIRLDKPTRADYEEIVTVKVDGQEVRVPKAEPLKDAQGNVIQDINGRTTPRYTTIYDAVSKLRKQHSVPVVCHQPHMRPVAVCRVCMVQIANKGRVERKLLPACQHQVKDGMEIFSMDDSGANGQRVKRSIKIVTELLTADALKLAPEPAPAEELAPFNELQQLKDRVELTDSRFKLPYFRRDKTTRPFEAPPRPKPIDNSSPVFIVDHSACILCDRCVRGCDEVKKNNVIARMGKGRNARIAFDLDDPMFESSCVQCGECMVSCPTSAITFKPVGVVQVEIKGDAKPIPTEDLRRDPDFAEIPPKFLAWQKGLVLRRNVKPNEILCEEGDPGHSAFIIREGTLNIEPRGVGPIPRTKEDFIVGEMACLSGAPRTARVRAATEGEIWEIRRNVLDRMMRSPNQRERFDQLYRDRALATAVTQAKTELFAGLRDQSLEFLKSNISLVRVNPGQTMFRQGDPADCMYIVRLGNVRVEIATAGKQETFYYVGPGKLIGELGLLGLQRDDAKNKSREQITRELIADFNAGVDRKGKRTGGCSALDHVELARIDQATFRELVRMEPIVLERLVDVAVGRLSEAGRTGMRDFLEQGLFQAQSLLALDLTRCTRCDECTKACIQQHGTDSHGQHITRLLREGLRFGEYLVATSCRSCRDAYCMIGCPVDAIHRGKHQQIVIEDHCIGCGLCARNCPYGNISMEPNLYDMIGMETASSGHEMRARLKAAVCDLCDAEGHLDKPQPRCVYACPHDAAHRYTGEQLLELVNNS
ncbi:MAG TPA: cyclic nucleotide-binding domain-containing protein [Bryobacteraceae bacterium]|nr:cyclic nucleotide-binding domain-containing protein [Bryobacteraceae bacterium]